MWECQSPCGTLLQSRNSQCRLVESNTTGPSGDCHGHCRQSGKSHGGVVIEGSSPTHRRFLSYTQRMARPRLYLRVLYVTTTIATTIIIAESSSSSGSSSFTTAHLSGGTPCHSYFFIFQILFLGGLSMWVSCHAQGLYSTVAEHAQSSRYRPHCSPPDFTAGCRRCPASRERVGPSTL